MILTVSGPHNLQSLDFNSQESSWHAAFIAIHEPGHWWLIVRYFNKWLHVDPYYRKVVEITPFPLVLPVGHDATIVMTSSTIQQGDGSLPFATAQVQRKEKDGNEGTVLSY